MRQRRVQWEEELRTGYLSSMALYRSRLLDVLEGREGLDAEECQGLIDMLNLNEAMIVASWTPGALELARTLNEQACRRVRTQE